MASFRCGPTSASTSLASKYSTASRPCKLAQAPLKASKAQNPPRELPRPHKLFLVVRKLLYVAHFRHHLKASKAPNPPQARPLQLSKANTAYMACFRWLLYTAPQSSLLRPRKLFLFAFETATWHVFRHPVKASKAQNLRSFWGYLLLPLLLPSSAATFASTRPHLPDFLTVSEQPFVTFGSEAPCLPDLARVLRCNLPPLLLQAVPAHTTSSLRRVPCCFPLWFYTALPAKPCQASFQGVGGTRASAHLYLMKAKKNCT